MKQPNEKRLKNREMEKEDVIAIILNVCRRMGLKFSTKVKSELWNADIVVDHKNYQIAFNVCKRPCNVERTYKAMHEERICGCWLLLPAKNSIHRESSLPCFNIEGSDKPYVTLYDGYDDHPDNKIELTAFIHDIIEGKIRYAKQAIINKVEICFFKENCWKCHKENDLYFVNRLYSSEGVSIDGQRLYTGEEDLAFNPSIVKAVKEYILTNPTINIKMGNIKYRYSKTIGDSYLSFGCAYCDKLFGNFFVHEQINELLYYKDSLQKVVLPIESIQIPVNCWYRME